MHGANPGRILFGFAAIVVPVGFLLFGLFFAIKQIAQKLIEEHRERSKKGQPANRARNNSRGTR
ncbi:MAG TPA: hypothetical protein VHC72_00345 [Bryobacteraceae bacterium]|nr:hypothetical protein [Bryobacteraceae bacterium]